MGTHPIFESDFDCLTDKEAVDEFLKTLPSPKPMVSRENFFKNLQAQAKKPETTEAEELDEDSIDESDKEDEKVKIEEMPEEVAEEVKVAEPEVKTEAEPIEEPEEEPVSTPEIITSQEVSEANQTPEALSNSSAPTEVTDEPEESPVASPPVEEIEVKEEIITEDVVQDKTEINLPEAKHIIDEV